MAMTRKHFEMIARVIHVQTQDLKGTPLSDKQDLILRTLREVADDFCVELRQENPQFDSKRFLKACGF